MKKEDSWLFQPMGRMSFAGLSLVCFIAFGFLNTKLVLTATTLNQLTLFSLSVAVPFSAVMLVLAYKREKDINPTRMWRFKAIGVSALLIILAHIFSVFFLHEDFTTNPSASIGAIGGINLIGGILFLIAYLSLLFQKRNSTTLS